MASDQGKSQLFGEGLPGTGGDFVDPNDVEGHQSGGPDQGHGWGEDAPGRASVRFIDEDDVEGHLHRSGPTTQGGEVARRVPSDNPHGER